MVPEQHLPFFYTNSQAPAPKGRETEVGKRLYFAVLGHRVELKTVQFKLQVGGATGVLQCHILGDLTGLYQFEQMLIER